MCRISLQLEKFAIFYFSKNSTTPEAHLAICGDEFDTSVALPARRKRLRASHCTRGGDCPSNTTTDLQEITPRDILAHKSPSRTRVHATTRQCSGTGDHGRKTLSVAAVRRRPFRTEP